MFATRFAPASRILRCALTAGLLAGGGAVAAPTAGADDPTLAGWYRITFHTDQKSGSSIAAAQPETPYTASYLFTTDCSDGPCIASAVDGPAPKENVSPKTTLEWDGAQWSKSRDWNWDCLLPDGTITYDPAHSVTNYRPQPDGSLTGSIDTTIDAGACAGTVSIPVTARPS